MADRSRAQIPVLTVNAIVLVLLAADSLNPGTSAPTSAAGTTFYVSPTGNDSASGSSNAPRPTIQKAADTLNAGQTAIVAAGNYRERVSITRSGTQASPITLQAASGSTAQMLGFDISGNSWQVSGFDISTQTNGNDGFGIYLSGTASYVTLQTNYIHELCHEGIFMDSGVTHISVLNNRIWRAEMAGVQAQSAPPNDCLYEERETPNDCNQGETLVHRAPTRRPGAPPVYSIVEVARLRQFVARDCQR